MFSKLQISILVILVLASSFVWYEVFSLHTHALRVYVLNVGQGDAILIETPTGNQILIDGGPGPQVLSELGKVMPAYDKSIDIVIATHTDMDHIGGLVEVLKRYKVDHVVQNGFVADTDVYRSFQSLIEKNHIDVITARVGDRVLADNGAQLDILGPFPEDFEPVPKKSNEAMIVSRLVFGKSSFLFTGDIERGDEVRLANSGLAIASDVLKVAHHGSRYSSTDLFLEKVHPVYAVISVGKNNRYGHPTADAIARIVAVGAGLLRTDTDGRIMFESDGEHLAPGP